MCVMALGVGNLAVVEQASGGISLSQREASRRGGDSSWRGERLFVASPLGLAKRVSVGVGGRIRQAGDLRVVGGQGYGFVRSMSRSGKGVAVGAGSSADAGYSVEDGVESGKASNESKDEEEKEEVTEVQLSGDDMDVQEIGDSLYSVRTLQKLVFKIGDGSKQFVMNSVDGMVGVFKKDKNKKQPELLAFEASSYESKDGKTALSQWTATELTMQHGQLVRIATDLNYLVFAFAFFGWVRVLEAVLAAFSTNPAKLRKLAQATNAMDPLTVAWLAFNLRKPILGILQVDPTDFQKLATLKGKFWEELHAFFERQWKVMATLAMVRFLGLLSKNIPASQWITSKVKTLWDVLMMVPIF